MKQLLRFLPYAAPASVLLAAPTLAQNDECTGAIALSLGATAFDTSTATLSATPWPCAFNGGPDLWYTYTAPNLNSVTFDTCAGTTYDTALEVFDGTCGALNPLVCNDDSCFLQSSINVTPSAVGDVFYIRVGGYNGATGAGTLTVTDFPPLTNDSCATAIALTNGVPTAFDNFGAGTSSPAWPCGLGGADIWYSFTPATSGVSVRFETCGSTFDTVLEVFDGSCSSLVPIECNDDFCGFQSTASIPNVVAGQTYYVRVGGFNGAQGTGTILATEGMPPIQGCVLNPGFETGDFSGWNFTDIGGPFYPGVVSTAGANPGFGFFTSAPTEGNYSFLHGFDGAGPDVIRLAQDVQVNGGLTPLTFDYRAAWDMASFTGSTLDRTFDVVVRDPANGNALQTTTILTAMAGTMNLDTGPMTGMVDLSMFIGQTVTVSFEWNIPETFTGPGFFELDNIDCPSGGGQLGTNYCMANANSTGTTAVISAMGSRVVSDNDLELITTDMPNDSFGFFLTSQVQGFVPNPGGSDGNLCLGGSIGRYFGPGQIQNSGSAGEISLMLDLTMTPTPTGFTAIQAGETWNFTTWFRDAVGGVSTSNFSDGLEIGFL